MKEIEKSEAILAKGEGWRIFGSEENPKLYVEDDLLREECCEFNVLTSRCYWDEEAEGKKPTERQRARMDRAATVQVKSAWDYVSNEDCREDVDEILKSASEDMLALVKTLREMRVADEKRCVEALRTGGRLSFDDMANALKPGLRIMLGEGELRHGAEIVECGVYSSMMGRYCHVSWKFLTHDGKSFREAQGTSSFFDYSGRKSTAECGLPLMSAQDEREMEERARRWAELVKKPTHVQVSGFVQRKSWLGGGKARADGRAMIDVRSMSRMDPNYGGFYGELTDEPSDAEKGGWSLFESSKVLACPVVYGFSFAAKRWGEFRVDNLRPAEYRNDAFDRLVMDERRKRLISALVEQSHAGDGSFSDFIDGKGGGAVFLLHGSPGVGKTLTAEAVSEKLRRPLYMVGAGELGTSPDEVEERLGNILAVAEAWDAVLLIDECDVFLERRQAADVERNAIVGIFLRLLEYYQGVLFMTTNRVGELDEAFLSRISLGLHYDPLSDEGRATVWRGIAETNNVRLSDEDVRSLARHEINGRQIKHALRLAAAVAKSESRALNVADLEEMLELSKNFARDFSKAREDESENPGGLEK